MWVLQSSFCHSSVYDDVPDAAVVRPVRSGYGFPFALIASLVGCELDFTFTALSVGSSSIFTHFSTFNSIRLVFHVLSLLF